MMEKKIKSSAERITMPDDVKKRILSKCAEIEKDAKSGNNNYTDHVFEVERIQPKRITRIISGLAACAVIAGGVGLTGVLLHRQGNPQLSTEITEELNNKISPFGDFSSHEFYFYTSYENVNYDYNPKAKGNYTDETYAKLARLLNNTEWTDGADFDAPEAKEKVYQIFWKDDTILNMLFVSDSGYVVYQVIDQSDTNDQQEMSRAYYSVNFDEFESAVQEILASDTSVAEDELPLIRDELQQLMANSISNDSVKAFISYNPENFSGKDVPESIKKDNSEIPADMLTNLASWIDSNATQLCNAPSRSNGLFYIDFNENGKKTAALSFMQEGYFEYQTFDTETGEETSFCGFMADSEEAFKAIIRSAADTEIKHTEDNAAYYLPGFNIVKFGITGDPEKDSALQDIFYGYDWAAHEVDELQVYGETPDYNFYYTTSIENVDCKYNLDVYRNGYIHLYYTDMNNEPILPDEEKIYKFDNDDIYKALSNYYSNNSIAPDFSDGSTFYSYANEKDILPEDLRFDNSADLTYTFLDSNKSGTFTENEKFMLLEILEFSFDMENELPDKEYSEEFGKIGLSISDVSHEDGSPFETTVHITDKNYMIISANDGNHIYKAKGSSENILELLRGFIFPANGASININTQD